MTLVNKLSHWTATLHADTAAGAKGITVNKELVLVDFKVSEYISKVKNDNSEFLKTSICSCFSASLFSLIA